MYRSDSVSTQRCNTMYRSDCGWMAPAERQSNEIGIAMEDTARGMASAQIQSNALEDAAGEIKIAEDSEKRLNAERDAARERYHCARTDYKIAQQYARNVVREIEVATDRVKKMKGERDVARSRYHFARRRCQVTQQWRLDMEKAAKQWKEDMQDLALWECATTNELPWVPWMSRDRAARHLNRGSPSSEEDESEAHEETPALPMHQGKDENEAKEDDAMTRESVSATPVAASVPEEVAPLTPANRCQRQQWERESNVDVQKRRRTNEGGGFKIDGRERSTTDTYIQTKREDSYNGECATVGCSRERHAIGNDATRLGWQGVFRHKWQKP